MGTLKRYEIFEIDALERMQSGRFLDGLVFGGGTMLRLCHELNRYSVDLDFWFVKKTDQREYFAALSKFLRAHYEVTDAQAKHFTLLIELRSPSYPMRLKIEIRKASKDCDFEDRIAFSKHSSKQVMVRVHTLEQAMRNKLEAAIERHEIRDFFDIEFLLRRGVKWQIDKRKAEKLQKLILDFKPRDFKVTLGSMLETDHRQYYVKNGFDLLTARLASV